MRKIVVVAFTSMDGVMQAPGGPEEDTSGGFGYGGWTVPHFDAAVGEAMGGVFAEPSDSLLGRKTYEIFAAHWPAREDTDDMAKLLGDMNKYVVTRNAGFEPGWRNAHVVSGDAVEKIKVLKAGDGKPLMTSGSADLLETLFANDLVDEVFQLVFPIVLGKGKRLFTQDAAAGGWRLVRSAHSPSGVVMNRYAREGAVETGSFAD